MLEVKEIANKKIWEKFLARSEIRFFPFFQSWNWGEVQKKLGHDVVRLGMFRSKKLVALCQIVDIKARRGHYLHLRHGPVLLPFDQQVFDVFVDYIKKMALEKRACFVRISPIVKKEHVNFAMLKKKGFLPAPIHNMDAEICWVLDIQKPEVELLKSMRKTHRYLIRKAETMDIEVVRTKNVSDIGSFLSLYSNLSKRKHFVPHKGVKEEFEEFSKASQEILFLAKHKRKVISGALIAFVGSVAIYRHGASAQGYKDIPASYLLQWKAILEAKKRGKALYNFWGIAPDDKVGHPWAGLTLFKKGFGGEKVEFLHAQDLPLTIWYWKTYIIEYISKLRKGY